jgi:hypothetical protein
MLKLHGIYITQKKLNKGGHTVSKYLRSNFDSVCTHPSERANGMRSLYMKRDGNEKWKTHGGGGTRGGEGNEGR